VKFNGSKILRAYENDLCTDAFYQEQRCQHRCHFHISAKEKVLPVLSSEDARRFKF
jgi:hypothetical protein